MDELISIKNKLKGINWNFDFTINYSPYSLFPFNCRKYFFYPATFIPEIPFTLIQILSKKGDVVLDPFGGIGTTFIQALLLERFPFFCDINPIAVNTCLSYYELFNPALNHSDIKNELFLLVNDYDNSIKYLNFISESQKELSDWFEEETFNQLSYLIFKYNQLNNSLIKQIYGFIISSIMSTISSQNKGWAYVADNVKPKKNELKNKAVFDVFKTKVNSLFDDINIHLKNVSSEYYEFYNICTCKKRVFNKSIIDSQIDYVDLIVTSPPYPKMVDYIKSQRMPINFFGTDMKDILPKEIGARYRRNNRDNLEEYEKSMSLVYAHLYKLLKNKGFMCLILPEYSENDIRKKTINNTLEFIGKLGFKEIADFIRYIPSTRRTISIQWASLVNEKIYLFQKEED